MAYFTKKSPTKGGDQLPIEVTRVTFEATQVTSFIEEIGQKTPKMGRFDTLLRFLDIKTIFNWII
jgi:hypothetical protein